MTVFTNLDASTTSQPKKPSMHLMSTTLPPKSDPKSSWTPAMTTSRGTNRRSSNHVQVDHADQESILQEIRLSNPPPNLYVYRPSKKRPVVPSPEEIDEIVQRLGVGRNAVALFKPKSFHQHQNNQHHSPLVHQEKPPVISIPQQQPYPSHQFPVTRPPSQTISAAASSAPLLTTDDISKPSVVPIDSIGKDVEVALQKIIEDLLDKKQFFSIPHNSIYDASKLINGKFSGKLAPVLSSYESNSPSASRNHFGRESIKQYSREKKWDSKYGFPDKHHQSQDQGSHVALFADRRPNFVQNTFLFPHQQSSRPSSSRPSFKDYLPPPHPMSSFYLSGNEKPAGNELKPYYTSAKSGLGPGLRSFASYVKVINQFLHPLTFQL
jgi:hypothetical protein